MNQCLGNLKDYLMVRLVDFETFSHLDISDRIGNFRLQLLLAHDYSNAVDEYSLKNSGFRPGTSTLSSFAYARVRCCG